MGNILLSCCEDSYVQKGHRASPTDEGGISAGGALKDASKDLKDEKKKSVTFPAGSEVAFLQAALTKANQGSTGSPQASESSPNTSGTGTTPYLTPMGHGEADKTPGSKQTAGGRVEDTPAHLAAPTPSHIEAGSPISPSQWGGEMYSTYGGARTLEGEGGWQG
ncbi:unnamed protein product [Vitrella brassicaformis CCMP3155]|uniref:Uncharacterized protein n=1 Tax=Vitrella brassicaformis (strain CCMP3155) TaxID=1169540 RepID=A0A0G4GK52_VITBC|nr:unnamed protein product [Vitrella brassicaformis CCMP3155]|mmetsp:Transcript_7399/g.21283  ORF Transcript_7399/g.21283 Transcript_7399/m.21283 type:complete len:164 (+) Transcript_7399:134-625(+)|eukprot:CEM30286.1 unnamed protein product [Vitrella brassicaformis CCMP3155]